MGVVACRRRLIGKQFISETRDELHILKHLEIKGLTETRPQDLKKIPGSKRCIFLLKSLLSSEDSPNYFPSSHVGSELGYQAGAKFKNYNLRTFTS